MGGIFATSVFCRICLLLNFTWRPEIMSPRVPEIMSPSYCKFRVYVGERIGGDCPPHPYATSAVWRQPPPYPCSPPLGRCCEVSGAHGVSPVRSSWLVLSSTGLRRQASLPKQEILSVSMLSLLLNEGMLQAFFLVINPHKRAARLQMTSG